MSDLIQSCTNEYASNTKIGVFGCDQNIALKIIKKINDSIDSSIEFYIPKYLKSQTSSTNIINVFDIEKINIINPKNDLTLTNIKIIKDSSLNFIGSSILYTMEDFIKLGFNLLPEHVRNVNFEKIFIILLIKLSLFFIELKKKKIQFVHGDLNAGTTNIAIKFEDKNDSIKIGKINYITNINLDFKIFDFGLSTVHNEDKLNNYSVQNLVNSYIEKNDLKIYQDIIKKLLLNSRLRDENLRTTYNDFLIKSDEKDFHKLLELIKLNNFRGGVIFDEMLDLKNLHFIINIHIQMLSIPNITQDDTLDSYLTKLIIYAISKNYINQQGGNFNQEKNNFHKKYLKYKNKYLSLKKLYGGNGQKITILTYNVSWESMTGRRDNCQNNLCKTNILKIFNDNKSDFFLIQEASNLEDITFSEMEKITHRSAFEDSIIYYNNKFKLLETIKGEFKTGRPYIIALFQKDEINFVVINVHLSEDIGNQETKLPELKKLEHNLTGLILSALEQKETKIIIGGDFNYNFTPPIIIEIFSRIFTKEEPSIFTCCDLLADGTIPLTHKYDHLLVSENIKLISFKNLIGLTSNYSDHLPMLYEINI